MKSALQISHIYTIADAPLRGRDYWVVLVSSMEQIIGTALSCLIGIMLPMMQLVMNPQMSSVLQGIVGAMGLIGIGCGSIIIGRLSDKQGYLLYFRLCPIIIIVGSLICLLLTSVPMLMVGLFLIGVGVGGGYSLDSAYISELMPDKWRAVMVGAAKASCAFGFIFAAAISLWILKNHPNPHIWNYLVLIITVLGTLTLIMRLRWAQSPGWLMQRHEEAEAQEAATLLLGKGIKIQPLAPTEDVKPTPWGDMFKGKNLAKVVFSGIPWACEGLGVYGFGVFLPALIMALGMGSPHLAGMDKVIESVENTTIVNCFILPGFIIGLLLVRRINHVKMLYWGFIGSALGLGVLLWASLAHLPSWVMIIGFLIYELSLNAGPHLITYIIPAAIYPVADRGAGSGIAALLGKTGAIAGVILMPILLEAGGIKLVLIVSIAVMLLGALIGLIFGKILKLT